MTETAPARWLLVLGSNAADAAAVLAAALASIATLGTIERCSTRAEGDDVAARGPRYLNQLVLLRSTIAADALAMALKQLEGMHGRSAQRLERGVCDLDIDLLARIDGDAGPRWLGDKPLAIPAVRQLLGEFGIR